MLLKEFKTAYSVNPEYKDYLLIVDDEETPKTYFIPQQEFISLIIKAGKRFNTIAPLAPYPHILGAVWKTNNTIYKWFVKRLKEVQEKYNWILDIENKKEERKRKIKELIRKRLEKKKGLL